MTILDRRMRGLLIAAVAVLIGPGSVASIVLYALAAAMLATGAAGYCPPYSLVGVAGRHRHAQTH